MTTLLIIIPFITFAAGLIAGVTANKLSTNNTIEQMKDDAKTAVHLASKDSFQAGYMRAYSDRNRRNAKMHADRMTAETQLIPALHY
jgi:hypothetical protein